MSGVRNPVPVEKGARIEQTLPDFPAARMCGLAIVVLKGGFPQEVGNCGREGSVLPTALDLAMCVLGSLPRAMLDTAMCCSGRFRLRNNNEDFLVLIRSSSA